jgi:type IV secretion system protein VirB8
MIALGRSLPKEVFVAPAVTRERFATYCQEVESFQASRVRTRGFLARLFGGLFVVSLAINAVQAYGLAHLLPLKQLVPVFLWVRPDGSLDSQVALSDLPATQQDAVQRHELWTYVRLRESYSKDTAPYNYTVTSAMSAPKVRQEYQKWFNAPNPTSPQMTIGDRGSITIRYVSGAYIARNVFQVTYERTVSLDGSPPVTTRWVVPVSFAKVNTIPASERLENPGAVFITDYPTPEQVSPQ